MANINNFNKILEKAEMECKEHQREAVEWGINNEISGHNIEGLIVRGGLIADEMGLGKTIEMLGIIVSNFKERTLIVLPRALLEQWESIIAKTTGHQAMVYHGEMKKELSLEDVKKAPIVLTTYGMISTIKSSNNPKEEEIQLLHMISWNRVIYDEAHHLRNNNTRMYRGALKIKSNIKWLMTGTPIQNKKTDFYSLCAVMGLPSDYYTVSGNLYDLVRKFILKRTKSQIGLELPELTTEINNVNWENDKEQTIAEEIHSMLEFSRIKKIYDNHRGGIFGESTLPLLMRARQTCIYPPLIKNMIEKKIEEGIISDEDGYLLEGLSYSSKLDNVTLKVLENKNNNKGKLIFCHFRGEIDVLKSGLTKNGLKVETFDGRVNKNERNNILTRRDLDVLILQIQTGCEGLNLQHFSEIYFVSPHWNPAVEDQAIARCHRIGQTEEIKVYRFNMVGFDEDRESQTIDIHAGNIQEEKRNIAKLIEID